MNGRRHGLIATIVVVTSVIALMAVFYFAKLTPDAAAAQADPIDQILRVLFMMGGGIFALVMALLLYSVFAFRRRPDDTTDGPGVQGDNRLEALWTIIPLAILIGLAVYGAITLGTIRPGPTPQELEVNVTGFQWAWQFEYPQQGITPTELRLPVNRPVLFRLHSPDVVHSFWVPEWRVKQDLVPGMHTELRITPTTTGSFRLLCAELCGVGHAIMRANVVVVPPAEFDRWVAEQKGQTK